MYTFRVTAGWSIWLTFETSLSLTCNNQTTTQFLPMLPQWYLLTFNRIFQSQKFTISYLGYICNFESDILSPSYIFNIPILINTSITVENHWEKNYSSLSSWKDINVLTITHKVFPIYNHFLFQFFLLVFHHNAQFLWRAQFPTPDLWPSHPVRHCHTILYILQNTSQTTYPPWSFHQRFQTDLITKF